MAAVRPERVDGLDALALEDDRLSVVVVPEVGAKIVSLQHRPSRRERPRGWAARRIEPWQLGILAPCRPP
ncbi:MAG TPA: hypothetical protein VG370_24585 [Chloroflexota bacterium]|jgi:galactose mutarotase-like enzyme|nr:hypothetical protein [Chloroflexota bacterium]